ncbi:hypothetical protein VLK31_27590 [Variovorax sp. H27-G14]|uniref:hypothetical protein n=1 Tax=Variovorax sp. H27-G14 TaxID=3111914 RepID=UPI0038FD1DB5
MRDPRRAKAHAARAHGTGAGSFSVRNRAPPLFSRAFQQFSNGTDIAEHERDPLT